MKKRKWNCCSCGRVVYLRKDNSYTCRNCGAWEDGESIVYQAQQVREKIERRILKGE